MTVAEAKTSTQHRTDDVLRKRFFTLLLDLSFGIEFQGRNSQNIEIKTSLMRRKPALMVRDLQSEIENIGRCKDERIALR